MNQTQLYPLKFAPLYQYRRWGGRRLSHWLQSPLPPDESVGEAWLLSDRDEHSSVVTDGYFSGWSLGQLFQRSPEELIGTAAGRFLRFPLVLKFLDVQDALSVQVHPSDSQKDHLPAGETGKTEAWVVLAAEANSLVYAGLAPHTTTSSLRRALKAGSVEDQLAVFTPKAGDAVLIPAGTVHSLNNVVVFEVQENSDVTFRLYDWNRIDDRTHQRRPLQIEEAMACINFNQGKISPAPAAVGHSGALWREQLLQCTHFVLWRLRSKSPFTVGSPGDLRVLVCIAGGGVLRHEGIDIGCGKGDVVLLPAAVGTCLCTPHGSITLLELSLPRDPAKPWRT